ncbi:MAG: 50S ribosomal protein L5 [Actinomycetota bacterium]
MSKVPDGYQPRLKKKYTDEIRPRLSEELSLNPMATPTLVKVAINMGAGDALRDGAAVLDAAVEDLKIITGQRPVKTKAKKSIAAFKLREGQEIGAKVTIRGDRAWEFLDRLISLAIPRIRDFRGLSPKGFDGRGNYTFGIIDQTIFPEVDYDKIGKVRGMDITLVTSAATDEQAKAFLRAFNFPFREN